VIELLNKRVDIHLQNTYTHSTIALEDKKHKDLVLRVGMEFIKLKKVCRDADFYIEEAIGMAIEESINMVNEEEDNESTIHRDYDRS
jgi:hypothetical protein